MKIRSGFVSNSSSSSFIIKKSKLTEDQILKIENHIEYWNETIAVLPGYNSCEEDYSWSIDVSEDFISGSTWLDNFSMEELFDLIDVNEESVKWSS